MAEQSLVTAMAALRRDEVGADCRLLVEGEEIRAHSLVLAARCRPPHPIESPRSSFFRARSDFLAAALPEGRAGGRRESRRRRQVLTENTCSEGAAREVTIEGRSATAVRQAVNFMYGIPINEASTDYEGLLDIAEYFMMDDFKEEVDKFIARNVKLTEENFLATSKLADTYRARRLAEGCARFLLAATAEVPWEEVERLPVVVAAATRVAVQANRAIVQAARAAQPCSLGTCCIVNILGRSSCSNCDSALAAPRPCGIEEVKRVVDKYAEA